MRRFRAAALLPAVLAGCTVGPNFTSPKPPEQAAWQDPSVGTPSVTPASDPDPIWWKQFKDPTLDALIDKAIAGNPDLQESMLRIVEARASVTTARAAGLPTLGGTGSYMREQLGLKGLLESHGAYKDLDALADQLAPLDARVPGASQTIAQAGATELNQLSAPVDVYQYGLDASWELDLFGRVRRSVEQAEAQSEATKEAANDALIVLESEVAQSYIGLRAAQNLYAAQEANIHDAQSALDLTRRLAQKGLNTDLDLEQAITQLDQAERQLPGFEKQVAQAEHQLAVLTGQPPDALDDMLTDAAPMPTPPSVVAVGVPSALARRRPDIREAEAQLHAATAGVGVAVANFYPDVSLTGSLGLRATDASYLTNWASHFYSFGPSVSLPIFQGGKLSAGLKTARAEEAEAALAYRGTVLNALREVEDALVSYRTDLVVQEKSADTLAAADRTLYLARDSFQHGLATFLQVLDAERTLESDRQQLVQAQMSVTDDIVALYRALGGGWQSEAAQPPKPQIDTAPPSTPGAADVLADPTPYTSRRKS